MKFDREYLESLLSVNPIGNDIDFSTFEMPSGTNDLPAGAEDDMKKVGIDLSENNRSATFIQNNEASLYKNINKVFNGKLEIMPLQEAMKKYDIDKYYFNAVEMKDKFTAFSELNNPGGYFLRVFAGKKVEIPIQACFLISTNNSIQNVHNIIIIEEGASAQIINGCTAQYKAKRTLHIGVTEIYLEKGSKFIYNMIHNWSSESYVRPRTGVVLADDAKFVSNYVTLYPIKDIQTFPTVRCDGARSTATLRSIVYGRSKSMLDLGGRIILNGVGSRGEIISHNVVADESNNITRSEIISNAPKTKGHIECRALMTSERAKMKTIPVLESSNKDAELTHEASIGKIDEEQLNYLMSRGISEDDAVSLMVRGFLDVDEMELTPYLKKSVKELIDKTMEGF